LGKYVSMWANTPPDGGILIAGQDDNKTFSGCNSLSDDELNRLERSHHIYCPDAKVHTKRVEVQNAKGARDFVVVFRVKYRDDIVVSTNRSETFVRIGDTIHEVKSPEELRELQADKGQIRFESQPSTLIYPRDFDQDAIHRFVTKVRKERKLNEDLSIIEILALRRLGCIKDGEFIPNIACSLLFGHDPATEIPGCKIRFQRFDGTVEKTGDQYNVVKNTILEGNIPSLIQQAESLVASQLRTFSPLNQKGKFYPVDEYPKDAWYEALVNACVHRSYGNGLRNMNISIKLFDNRLEIESPGPFPPHITPSNIFDSHHPRNPDLMDALFYLEYVQCAHEGTRRIRDSMARMELPAPKFQQEQQGRVLVKVTLSNNIAMRRTWVQKDVSDIISEAIAADLTANEKELLNWIAINGKVTIRDAERHLQCTWATAKRTLTSLAERRILQYVRFRPMEKNLRDSKAFFQLRGAAPIPPDGFEQTISDRDDS